MGSSDDTEKMIQRLNEELQEAQERADTERQKNVELKGNVSSHPPVSPSDRGRCSSPVMHFYSSGLLEEERKDNRQQVEESAKEIQHLQGFMTTFQFVFVFFLLNCNSGV